MKTESWEASLGSRGRVRRREKWYLLALQVFPYLCDELGVRFQPPFLKWKTKDALLCFGDQGLQAQYLTNLEVFPPPTLPGVIRGVSNWSGRQN